MPDVTTDDDPVSTRPRHRRVLLAVVAAVAVGALVFGVDELTGTAAGALRKAVAKTSSPRTITERAVADLLAAAPVPPGAHPMTKSPIAALDQPPTSPASDNLVSRTKWWTVGGTPDSALRYVNGHLPAGLQRTEGFGEMRGPGLLLDYLSSAADGSRWTRPTIYTELQLLVSVTPLGSGVAVRVDAQAIWQPQRTAAEHVPSDVTSVEIVSDRNGTAPTVRRTLGSRAAEALAHIVNSLPTLAPSSLPSSCPQAMYTDTLTFRGPGGAVVVRAVGHCRPVTFVSAGRAAPQLDDGGRTLDQAVLRALGLPTNYGL